MAKVVGSRFIKDSESFDLIPLDPESFDLILRGPESFELLLNGDVLLLFLVLVSGEILLGEIDEV